MTDNINYFIGRAEVLTHKVDPPRMNPNKQELYSVQEMVERLEPQFKALNSELAGLGEDVCPRGFAVTKLTLHPSYIAKGHFPQKVLRELGARSIGSKSATVKPDRWTKQGTPQPSPTTSLFIAGQRNNFNDFESKLSEFTDQSYCSGDLAKIWSVEFISPLEKIKNNDSVSSDYFEVGIQMIPGGSTEFIKSSFINFAMSLGFEVQLDLAFDVSNLWFVPLRGDVSNIETLASHSFLRVVRPMPALRSFRPLVRNLPATAEAELPVEPPLAQDIRVAILDGGLPERHVLSPWVSNYRLSDPDARDCEGGTSHGVGVTSAFLFGPLSQKSPAPRPFSYVDHHRVLDDKISGEDPLELYRTLANIEDILISRQYEFLNISLGPNLPIDDDEIHPWTSLLDSYLADGETFLTVAAGNNGDGDSEACLNRIQVPSDCVNAIAVGAADNLGNDWKRARYSAVGPGRAPGRVKPDLISFGGSYDQYFHVVSEGEKPGLIPQQGTSFSAPYLLRKAVGIRALFGHNISPLTIKALLINTADRGVHDQNEVGWGKTADDISKLIQSSDGVAKILYQGELLPGKYLRVPLPVPDVAIKGKVKIKATCCFTTPVDPQDTSMYTKAGIEISWSPKPGKKEPFFLQQKIATEAELRRDAAKWETVLHAEKNKIGNKLEDPAFEIHYMARDSGAPTSSGAPKIKYAFVVTLEAPKHPSIFNDILEAYSNILTKIEPRIASDVQVGV